MLRMLFNGKRAEEIAERIVARTSERIANVVAPYAAEASRNANTHSKEVLAARISGRYAFGGSVVQSIVVLMGLYFTADYLKKYEKELTEKDGKLKTAEAELVVRDNNLKKAEEALEQSKSKLEISNRVERRALTLYRINLEEEKTYNDILEKLVPADKKGMIDAQKKKKQASIEKKIVDSELSIEAPRTTEKYHFSPK